MTDSDWRRGLQLSHMLVVSLSCHLCQRSFRDTSRSFVLCFPTAFSSWHHWTRSEYHSRCGSVHQVYLNGSLKVECCKFHCGVQISNTIEHYAETPYTLRTTICPGHFCQSSTSHNSWLTKAPHCFSCAPSDWALRAFSNTLSAVVFMRSKQRCGNGASPTAM